MQVSRCIIQLLRMIKVTYVDQGRLRIALMGLGCGWEWVATGQGCGSQQGLVTRRVWVDCDRTGRQVQRSSGRHMCAAQPRRAGSCHLSSRQPPVSRQAGPPSALQSGGPEWRWLLKPALLQLSNLPFPRCASQRVGQAATCVMAVLDWSACTARGSSPVDWCEAESLTHTRHLA